MSAVLGVSCGYHDAAAALIVDGRIVAAIQEERLSRVKNDPSLPSRAIAACLGMGGVDAASLDRVVFHESPYATIERVLVASMRTFPRGLAQWGRALASQLGDKLWVLDALARTCRVPRSRVLYRAHHESHAASAFFASPFDHAAVLTVDGVGELTTTAIHEGRGASVRTLESIEHPHSLGLLWAALTAYLGFEVNEGEQKVMGLAAFGTPRMQQELSRVVRLDPGGGLELELEHFAHHADADLAFGAPLEALLGPRRPIGAPWDLDCERDRRYADVAATLQAITEDALLALARRAQHLTGARCLALAGGVALNAVATSRLARDSGFDEIFVQPAAGDAGGALGAAMLAAIDLGDARPAAMLSAALGMPIDAARGLDVARALGFRARRCEDPAMAMAERIARGEIVALASGRFEWGPRALGQRSLLADAADARSRERLNRVVKRREPFRPFAPSALASFAADAFDPAPRTLTRFMTTVTRVRDTSLAAVTHVDGTARLHVVDEDDGMLHRVLDARARSGLAPVVLDTSLNGRGEPICASAEDVLAFFLSHSVDAAYIEDVEITR